MLPHVRNYLKHFGYGEQDIILCENCGMVANDCHHIESAGLGGKRTKNEVGNIIALCRPCHQRAHGVRQPKLTKEYLTEKHLITLKYHRQGASE